MKKISIAVAICFSFSLWFGCGKSDNPSSPGDNLKKGSVTISFSLGSEVSPLLVNDDFSQVASGKVFLSKSGVNKYNADITIDVDNKTGEANLSDVVVGPYDVLIELYDADDEVIYSGDGTVTIVPDASVSVNINLQKSIATLSISGSWTEDIPGVASGIIQLKKNGIVKYAGNLVIDTDAKTISGNIVNIRPKEYDIYVEIRNTEGLPYFTGTANMTIVRGANSLTITLVAKTGTAVINVTGDVSAPEILSGPALTFAGQNPVITWSTNENATSNVVYSTTQGFDYQTTTDWAPVGQDLTPDTASHSVTLQGLAQNATYYYVVVSSDVDGNMVVGDEGSFTLSFAELLTDGFEEDLLNPFWTKNGMALAENSPEQAWAGSRSVKLTGAGGDYTTISHDYSVPVKGTVSVWFYDTFAQQYGPYGLLQCDNLTVENGSGRMFALGVDDWLQTLYLVKNDIEDLTATSLSRTVAWHKLEMRFGASQVDYYIDDILVHTLAGDYSFNRISFSSAYHDGSFYYDDFSITPQ